MVLNAGILLEITLVTVEPAFTTKRSPKSRGPHMPSMCSSTRSYWYGSIVLMVVCLRGGEGVKSVCECLVRYWCEGIAELGGHLG
jgi:hypothetical protein